MDSFDVRKLGTILGVWAHPDDEGYLSAGLMCSARDLGQRVLCVTATRGELGAPGSPDEVAELRVKELDAALGILGVEEHRWLDYKDGECASVPVDEGAAVIERLVREARPDTVLTFGPDGMTGHPDHRAVSRWTTRAVARVGSGRPDLQYATLSDEVADLFRDELAPLDVYGPGTPPRTGPGDLTIRFALPSDVRRRKIAAMRAQQSQTAPVIDLVGDERYAEFVSVEYFRRPTTAELDGAD